MIVVFSNRKADLQKKTIRAFGNTLSDTLHLCTATRKQQKWSVNHIDVDAQQPFLEELRDNRPDGKPWVFVVHGYNIDFLGSLKQLEGIADKHDVNIFAFSWPSKTIYRPFKFNGVRVVSKYRASQKKAEKSAPMLNKVLSMVNESFLSGDETLNLLVHSLGNYLLKNMCSSESNLDALSKMNNIILSQPDVDYEGHQSWVSSMPFKGTCFVITNWQDQILSFSNTINKVRLGQSIDHQALNRVTYVDYTDAVGIGGGTTHGAFKVSKNTNSVLHGFIYEAIRGKQNIPTSGFTFIDERNTYQIDHRYGNEFGPARRIVGGRARREHRLNNHRRINKIGSNDYY